ncbi:unnamed protein product [Durusdinium trenchii]|uniref:Uncharacterized protein n=1 Tax=Durusdinium trenchii TaxID=1381693 RepID=A0ABP0R250_9DINO
MLLSGSVCQHGLGLSYVEPLVSSIEFSLSLAQSSEGCVNLGENRLQAERPATVTAAEWFVKPSPCFDHPQMGQGCHHLPMLNLVLLSLIWGSSNLECLASLQERATAATGLRFYPVSNPGACREPRCSVVFVCPLLLRGAHRHGGYGDTPHTSLSATSDPRTARFIEGILRCKGPARAMDQVAIRSLLDRVDQNLTKLTTKLKEAGVIKVKPKKRKGDPTAEASSSAPPNLYKLE